MTFQVEVNQYIEQHQLLSPHDRLLIGVSGGPDSLALLHYFNEVKNLFQIEIAAVTVDHGLRGAASQADLIYVEVWCRKRNIPCFVKTVDVPAYQARHQVGTQAAARHLRYEAFYDVMKAENYGKLALAHHLDDQLETSVMAFIKSANATALTGIPIWRAFHDKKIIRPFLEVTRQAIEAYVEKYQLEPREDASNLSDDYLRNRVRHHLIPNLKSENQNILKTNAELRAGIAEDEMFIQTVAKKVMLEASISTKGHTLAAFDLEQLQAQAQAVLRRVFRIFAKEELAGVEVDYKHEAQFIAMVHDPGNKIFHLPSGWMMAREYQTIIFRKTRDKKAFHYQFELNDIPFSVYFDGYGTIRGEKNIDQEDEKDIDSYLIPADAIQWPIHIRSKLPGDRMAYDGLRGRKKVSRIFIDEKIPPLARQAWPIVTDGQGEILWLPQLKKKTISHGESSKYIKLTLTKNEGE